MSTAPATRSRFSPRSLPHVGPSLVVAVLSVALMATWLRRSGLGLSTFVIAGELRADAAAVPDELLLYPDTVGYDGRFFYRLALDPFTDQSTDFGIVLDHPAYRQRRILYPLLAHILHVSTNVSVLVWLPVINLIAVVVMTALVAHVCLRFGRSPWWAVLVGLSPPMYIGLTRDMAEPLALTLAVAGTVGVLHRRWAWAAALFALAALTRETTLVFPAGVGLWLLFQAFRSRRSEMWLAAGLMVVPLAALLLWEVWLRQNWGGTPIAADVGRQLAMPWLEVLKGLYTPSTEIILQADDRLQWLWRIERFTLVGLFVATAFLLPRSRLHPGLKLSWVLAVVLAGAPAFGWAWDAQFIRSAAEAIILMQLLLIATPGVRSRIALEVTGLLGLMVMASS